MKNKKLMIVICAVLALMGLVLLLATPAGLIFIAGGIAGIIYYARKKAPAPEPVRASRNAAPEPIKVSPSRKAVMSRTTKVAGVTFACHLDREYYRQDVFNRMWEGEKLRVDRYKYKGAPALLLVDPLQDLDIGTVPADLAEEIDEKYPYNEIEAYLVSMDSFWPDDSDDEITTAKVKLFVLEEE